MQAAYIGCLLHVIALLFLVIHGVWNGKRFSMPFGIILALLLARSIAYFLAFKRHDDETLAPRGIVTVSLLSVELVVSAWHVCVVARIQRSRRFVLTLLIGSVLLDNAFIVTGDADGCSVFGPLGFALLTLCALLLARAVRGGASPFSMQTKRVPIECLAFHLSSCAILLVMSIRSDTCLHRATKSSSNLMVVFADAVLLAPVVLSSWLRMDELVDAGEFDNDDDDDGAL